MGGAKAQRASFAVGTEVMRTIRGFAEMAEARASAPLGLVLLFSTCAVANALGQPTLKTDPARTFFYEQDFVADPTLVALPSQVSVLTLAPASGTNSSLQQHKVRYQLSSGAYYFCLKGDPSLSTMTITDPSGQAVVNIALNACSTVGNLQANTYDISVWHDPAKVPGKARIIFVQLPAPHVKTINADGTPKSGYWALQPDPALDPTGAGRAGRLHALPQQNMVPPNPGIDQEVVGMPLAADWTSTEFDDAALIRLDAPKLYSNDIPLTFFPVITQTQFNPVLFGNSDVSNPSPIPNLIDQIVIDDRADGTVRVGVTSQTVQSLVIDLFFYTSPRWAFVDTTSFLTFPHFLALPPLPAFPPPPSLLARLLFRFFPASKNLPPPALEEGEVEFFQSCDYSGDATVFNRDIANLAALASATAKVNQGAAVKLGPNTQAILYSEPGFAGTSQAISSDTTCLQGLPIGTSIGSLQIRSPVAPFSASSDCSSCQLSGINLSNSVLDGATLSGTDLSSANLASASLIGAVLEDVNLSHAAISQAHFDQADMKGTSWLGVDLRTAGSFANLILDRASGFGDVNLEGVDLTDASLREIDFNFTNLTNAKLSHADLTGANLTQTLLNGADLTNHAILHKADLTFSDLTGAQLPGADLTNASLVNTKAGANFTGAHLDGSYLYIANFSSATLNGATLNGGVFGLTVLAGATVNGATFAGVNMGDAREVKEPKRLAFAAHVTFVTSGSHLLLHFIQVIDFFQRWDFRDGQLNQFFRQMVPNAGPYDPQVNREAVSALFNKIGPGILFTHSQSGGLGWRTAIKNRNVRAIVSFEPAFDFPFPQGDVPPPMTFGGRALSALTVTDSEFTLLTKIPIVIYYGDNIPEKSSVNPGQEQWRIFFEMAKRWRDVVNRHGGDVTVVHLPEIGIRGNTHFPMSDMNNLQIADQVSKFLSETLLSKTTFELSAG
jgi:uncharacterized protein YjbI with pentapeptide repeats